MRGNVYSLSESDRRVYEGTRFFIDKRLMDYSILDWAAKLGEQKRPERLAVLHAIDFLTDELHPIWRAAWRLLAESWGATGHADTQGTAFYEMKRRLSKGDASGDAIIRIVDLVRPNLIVKARADDPFSSKQRPKRPRSLDDLLYLSISAGHPVDPIALGINTISDAEFLTELADELQSALMKSMHMADRLGMGKRRLRLGVPRRVYYVPTIERDVEQHEPDEFSSGIEGAIKLLVAVVEQLSIHDRVMASRFLSLWRESGEELYQRMWCALARLPNLVPAEHVYQFLTASKAHLFWGVESAPEVAEMRAIRFSDMGNDQRMSIAARIMRGPPRSYWSRELSDDEFNNAKRYRTAREFRRIKNAGARLPDRYEVWLDTVLPELPQLELMTKVTEDFSGFRRAQWVPPNPDDRFDQLRGEERLRELETALATAPRSWHDDPAQRATDWMMTPGRASLVVHDFEHSEHAGAAYPAVWRAFGSAHRPHNAQELTATEIEDARGVLMLLNMLPLAAGRTAIEGISNWLSAWEKFIKSEAPVHGLLLKFWPLAAEAAEAEADAKLDPLNTAIQGDPEHPRDLDTLNTPAGHMVGVFLELLPTVRRGERPFAVLNELREIRDEMLGSGGRAGLIARYRMLEELDYFLMADPEWTETVLLAPLLLDSRDAPVLWRAVARQRRFTNVLSIIGNEMLNRATDFRLGREVRGTLAVSVSLEVLHSINEHRNAVIPIENVTQMLRSLDEEPRVEVAQMLQRFVQDLSVPREDEERKSPEALFRDAVRKFLEDIWPQETGLATPPLSRALADLPATCGEEFVNAVNVIERFLVPFESWSLYDYGLRRLPEEDTALNDIDSVEKAEALLRLFDATISGAEGVAIPMDLGDALERIREIAPGLVDRPVFRRLRALSRR